MRRVTGWKKNLINKQKHKLRSEQTIARISQPLAIQLSHAETEKKTHALLSAVGKSRSCGQLLERRLPELSRGAFDGGKAKRKEKKKRREITYACH